MNHGIDCALEANGYKEGEKLVLDYQNAQGDQANLQTISEQLIDGNDIVLAIATPSAQSLATVSNETPIVFTAVTDPLSAGLVESIEKPGGLLTGTSDQAPIDKQVELLGQAVPDAKTVGILYTTSERNSEVQVEQAKELLEKAGYKVVVNALFIPTDNTVASTMTMIGELSVEHKVPVIGGSTDMVDEGGLLTYGTNYEALGRQTAKMAIKIIEGANVSETAVEYPETVSLHVNEEMAQKLGIDTSKLAVSE